MSREKGNRRERQCREFYERAGYEVQKAVQERWGVSDLFGWFDFIAINPDGIRLVQVKSDSATGIVEMAEWADAHTPECATCEYAVYHDGQGWRLVQPDEDGGYSTVYDERDDPDIDPAYPDKSNMGDGLVRFLGPGD